MSNPITQPIGILDTGVGGLTVLAAVRDAFPHEDIVYVGDSLRNPYGPRPIEEIRTYTLQLIDWLVAQGVKAIVLACNTISVTVYADIVAHTSVPIIGMEMAAKRAVQSSSSQRIGVMATVATIHSHSHRLALETENPAVTCVEVACPELAATIEHGMLEGPTTDDLVASYMAPFLAASVDTVIMGCTHYPFVFPRLRALTKGAITFLNPAQDTAHQLGLVLAREGLLGMESGKRGRLRLAFTALHPVQRQLADRIVGPGTYSLEAITL